MIDLGIFQSVECLLDAILDERIEKSEEKCQMSRIYR